jgi:hypothetical protein
MLPANTLKVSSAVTGSQNPPGTECKRLASHLLLVNGVIYGLGAGCLSHSRSLIDLLLRVSRIEERSVVARAIEGLNSLVNSLSVNTIAPAAPLGQAVGVPGSLRGAVARWFARDMAGSQPLEWEVRSAEGCRAAEAVLEACLMDARSEITAMVADGSIRDPGHAVRLRLYRAQALLHVVAKHAGPFGAHAHVREDAVGLLGPADEAVDSIAICADVVELGVGSGLRGEALQAALTVVENVDVENTWALQMAVPIIQVCIDRRHHCCGNFVGFKAAEGSSCAGYFAGIVAVEPGLVNGSRCCPDVGICPDARSVQLCTV